MLLNILRLLMQCLTHELQGRKCHPIVYCGTDTACIGWPGILTLVYIGLPIVSSIFIYIGLSINDPREFHLVSTDV